MQPSHRPKHSNFRQKLGFTLVELLVVIAIIGLLVALFLPSLQRARSVAQGMACSAAARGIGQATWVYGSDNKDQLVKPYSTPAGSAQGRFVGGADPYVGTTLDTTLTGQGIPKAGIVRYYADILVEGGYISDSGFRDPGRDCRVSLVTAGVMVNLMGLPGAFKTVNATGGTVPAYLVPVLPMQFVTTLMLDTTGNNSSSVNATTVPPIVGNLRQYYTLTSGYRHMRISNRPFPNENMWLTCIPLANGGPLSLTSWGYPQISPYHPSAGGRTNGVDSLFFDGHVEVVDRSDIYFSGSMVMRTTAGADGNKWPDPLLWPNFRPRYWDIRNTNPLGGASIGNTDGQNIALDMVTN